MPIKIGVEIKPIRGITRFSVSTLSVANKYLWFGLNDGNIMKFSHEDEYNNTESPRIGGIIPEYTLLRTKSPGSEVRNLYVDSKSFHCLVCLTSGDHYYSNFQSTELYFMRPLQRVFIRSLAFTELTSENHTDSFLIGTQQGSLIEGRIDYSKPQYYFKSLHVIPGSEPILSTQLIPILYKNSRTFLVVAVTTKRLYEFFGGLTIQDTFSIYSPNTSNSTGESNTAINNKNGNTGLRYEVPLAAPYGELLVVEKDDGSHTLFWTNATGIVFSSVPRKVNENQTSCLEFPPNIISYPTGFRYLTFSSSTKNFKHHDNKKNFLHKPPEQIPKSAIALNNHLLLLFDEIIIVINTIIKQQVASFSLPYGTYGEMKKLVKDQLSGLVCLLSSDALYEIVIQKESDDSWHYHMLKGDMKSALEHCKTSAQRDQVSFKAALDYFEKGMFEESARMYAELENQYSEIENVFLKFNRPEHEYGLIEYITRLLQKMDINKAFPKFIILTIWLVELISFKFKDLSLTIEAGIEQGKDVEGLKTLYNSLKQKFSRLIISVKDIDELVAPINFILQTTGCIEECIEYAKLRNDTSTVICHHITNGNNTKALTELSQMPPSEKRDSLFLRFAPLIFMDSCESFAKVQFQSLPHNYLIPILTLPTVLPNPNYLDSSLRILRRILSQPNEMDTFSKSLLWSIYIVLLTFLPTEDNLLQVLSQANVDFTKLDLSIPLRYLKLKSYNSTPLDSNNAVKLNDVNHTNHVNDLNHTRWMVPFIHLLSLCGMVDDALDLSLKINDLILAQKCAMKPQNDFDKRKLWLKILKHSSVNKPKNITSLLNDSKGFIQINDLLDYLHKDISLCDLKGVIDEFLLQYEDNIQERRQEIENLCNYIEETKSDIQLASKRFVNVSISEECSVCSQSSFLKNFIVFPCGHVFHRGCIAKILYTLLKGKELSEFESIKGRFDEFGDGKSESDYVDYLSRACLLCGYPILLLASQPFITNSDIEELEKWTIQ
ncbi:Pep3/Vps18/deep orange family protein [Theileria parva strain Muguga]|uniref:Pep3/Vps18/deep orange family protein n=1 Tax=Theileria parva strain Muguga TaxID=333668 RepID=UPI001C61DFB8|nr:Pep3/Vps18/deep orange family protein [Theileria parva strain Muguga]EAN32361.2 Pep3/Vps18/deep orange family protein [Theileria parva strain Muguga]